LYNLYKKVNYKIVIFCATPVCHDPPFSIYYSYLSILVLFCKPDGGFTVLINPTARKHSHHSMLCLRNIVGVRLISFDTCNRKVK
jgi:hypothetical protein